MSYSIASNGLVLVDGKINQLDTTSNKKFQEIVAKLWPIIKANSNRAGVSSATIAGIIWAETGFLGPVNGATAISPSGAIGRMQLMPFWFNKPTAIGDGKAHTQEEMFQDGLNVRFGTDLLKLIQQDGNDLPSIASIYNCGSATSSHPWRPHPSPPYKGQVQWGYCAEGAYIDNVTRASNSFLLTTPAPAPSASPRSSLLVLGATVTTFVALRRLLR